MQHYITSISLLLLTNNIIMSDNEQQQNQYDPQHQEQNHTQQYQTQTHQQYHIHQSTYKQPQLFHQHLIQEQHQLNYKQQHTTKQQNHNLIQQQQQQQQQHQQHQQQTTKQTTKQIQIAHQMKVSKTQNSSLFQLDAFDTNLLDSENTNLLDIINNNDCSEYIKFLDGRQIFIDDETQVISEGYITSYKLYTIYSRGKPGQADTQVKRRFSDFEFLQQQLFQMYPGHIIPILPEKNFWASLNMEGKQYLEQRIKRLKKYLDSLQINPKLRLSSHLRLFLFDSSAEFAQIKGQFEQKSKLQDKVKTIAGKVFTMGKDFISSLITKKNLSETKSDCIQYISKDNLQVTELCLKLKSFYDSVLKMKPQINNKSKQQFIISTLPQEYIAIDSEIDQLKSQLLESFQDAQYYIQSCWSALQRYGKLSEQLEVLKQYQQSLLKKHKQNPRSKQMDLVRNKIKRLSEKLQKSNSILQQQIKIGVLRAEYLFKTTMELYLKYRKVQFNSKSA